MLEYVHNHAQITHELHLVVSEVSAHLKTAIPKRTFLQLTTYALRILWRRRHLLFLLVDAAPLVRRHLVEHPARRCFVLVEEDLHEVRQSSVGINRRLETGQSDYAGVFHQLRHVLAAPLNQGGWLVEYFNSFPYVNDVVENAL